MTKFDFIWNISLICGWDCKFCCTDAVYVKKNDREIILKEKGLKETFVLNLDFLEMHDHKKYDGNFSPNAFDYAAWERQARGLEITYEEKLRVLDNLKDNSLSIDFAGGDPLACFENFLIIEEASRIFGKDNISITSTAHSINRYGVKKIAAVIGEYEFTFDEPPDALQVNRPAGYNFSNVAMAAKFSNLNVKTKCQIPIHEGNADAKSIASIYEKLSSSGVEEILLMRVFQLEEGWSF